MDSDNKKSIQRSLQNYIAQNPETATNLLNKGMDIFQEISRSKVQIKAMETAGRMRIEEMAMKYNQYRDTLATIYGERFSALNKVYSALDYGLENNDPQVIINSLKSISDIVTENPIDSFVEFQKILDDPDKTLELDF